MDLVSETLIGNWMAEGKAGKESDSMRVLKSLFFYPLRLIGGWVVFMGHLLAIFFLFGACLIGALRLVGELTVSGWIIAACATAGVGFRVLTEHYIRSLMRLKPSL